MFVYEILLCQRKRETGEIKKMRMVVFDLDGVLVDIESSWEMIHKVFGVNNEINFQKHLKKEIDFEEFMRSDIRLWNRPNIDRIKISTNQLTIKPISNFHIDCTLMKK